MRIIILSLTLVLMALDGKAVICSVGTLPEQSTVQLEAADSLALVPVETVDVEEEEVVPAPVVATDSNDQGVKSKDKKKGKKKEKKKKKEKEIKSPEEIIAMIKDFEWTKPPLTGTKIDEYYSTADEFFKNLKQVDEEIRLFKVCKITSPSGESTIAPVDLRTGAVRHKNEAASQVMQAVSFGATLGLQSSALALMTVGCVDQIAKDAIPLVGDPVRKKANVQIAKSVKAFKLLKSLIDSQRNMMDRYFKANANVETTDSVSEAIAVGDVDFMDVMEMSDEELAAYMEAEENASK